MTETYNTNKIHTACKDCTFAIYVNGTQHGCALDKLHLFKKNGINILEAYDESNIGFYIIDDAKCYFYRDKSFMYDKDFEDVKKHVLDNTKICYQVIIFSNNNMEDMEKTLLSALQQNPPPIHIAIVRRFMDIYKPTEYLELLQRYEKQIPLWRLQNVVDIDLTDEQAIDLVIDFEPMPIYSVFQSGFDIPKNLFNTINNRIIHLEQPFAALLGINNNGFVSYTNIHKKLNGNAEKPFIEKLKENVETPDLLQPITNICPNFPV